MIKVFKRFPAIILLLPVLLVCSCKTQKTLNYFSLNDRDSSQYRLLQNYEVPIQPGDKLTISVAALNPASASPYNLGGQSISVDPLGRILYPQLGFMNAAGLTRFQMRDTLLRRLKPYLMDPVVSVDFANFKVTMLGEVVVQGPILVPDGKISLLEALGKAGDVSPYANKDSVLIIRETGTRREFGYLNLKSNKIFNSPYFRLQQNDIVYVPATSKKPNVDEQVYTRRLSLVSATIGILSTLALLVFTITKK